MPLAIIHGLIAADGVITLIGHATADGAAAPERAWVVVGIDAGAAFLLAIGGWYGAELIYGHKIGGKISAEK